MRIVGWIVTAIALYAVAALVRGVALVALWGWFVQPLGVVDINLAQAVGISLVAAFLTNQYDSQSKDEDARELLVRGVVYSITYSIFALGIGAVVSVFV